MSLRIFDRAGVVLTASLLLVVAGSMMVVPASRADDPPAAPTPAPDMYEGDNGSDAAYNIGLNEAQRHTVSPSGDVDWIRFAPPAAGEYSVSIYDSTIPLVVGLRVQEVGRPEDPLSGSEGLRIPAGGRLSIPWTAGDGTRHLKLEVSGQNRADTGSYVVAVTQPGVEPPTPAEPMPAPTAEAPAVPPSAGVQPRTAPAGRLAVPIDDGAGRYDVVIFQIPEGQEIGRIARARQPNFRSDGVLGVNGEGGSNENIWSYNVDGSGGVEISASPGDSHPFWRPDGNGLVYDNPDLVCAKSSCPEWHVFVQNKLTKPETFNVASRLILEGDILRDQPMFPLWAADDHIIFRACDYWLGGGETCGIWRTPSHATHDASGFTPPANLTSGDEIPTDTKGDRLVFMSDRAGNWEVHSMGITGGPDTNLSNHPAADGLGTLSPDGRWVAFVSNRSGQWGVWVAPSGGGQAAPLPITIPGWGTGVRDWTTERISWGP